MKPALSFAWRSVVVGAGYAGTLLLAQTLSGNFADFRWLLWTFVGGVTIGSVLGPLASRYPATWKRHTLVWGSIIFFNIASVTIEGRFFAPGHVQGSLVLLLFQQLAAGLAGSGVIVWLFGQVAQRSAASATARPWYSWLWRFAASSMSYIVFYYFFGAINYLLVTGPYYRTHEGGLVTPPPGLVLQAELIRAPLIVLSVVPFLLSFRGTTRKLGVLLGIILFAVGGLAPLLMTVHVLPIALLAASAVEIFFQNFCTGLVIGRLLGNPQPTIERRNATRSGLAETEG